MTEIPGKKFDSQKERWLKYGANVAVSSIVVIILAIIIVYLAQKTGRRLDTTESRAYSLKPQTLSIIKDIKGKVKIVSLYRTEVLNADRRMTKNAQAGAVEDLLDEYRRNSSKIEVETIDPIQNKAKVDTLIDEVSGKYGGEVQAYKKVIEAYPETFKQLKAIAAEQTAEVQKLPIDQLGQDDKAQLAQAALTQLRTLPRVLESAETQVKDALSERPPDYKAAVREIQEKMEDYGSNAGKTVAIFKEGAAETNWPQPVRDYMKNAVSVYEQIKKLTDDLAKQSKDLGELKLDDLRRSLSSLDTILVVGDNDLRVIPKTEVWPPDDRDRRQLAPGQTPKPRFAGEQQISTAIHALNQSKKTKVAFVRTGGPPVTMEMPFPFRGGPMAEVARRLRLYNFDVLEKDLSGMWAMQAQMQQMPSPPDATDEQIKDAIWIVINSPPQQEMRGMPPPTVMPKVMDHLNGGGSALIMFDLRSDAMNDLMRQWGVEVRTDAIAVHEMIPEGDGRRGDMIEEALRYPFVFDIRDYGDHAITTPLRSLASLFVPLCPVKTVTAAATTQPSDKKVTPIIPIPAITPIWGETGFEGVRDWSTLKFDKDQDVEPPMFGGAAVEATSKGNRLVVIGSGRFADEDFVTQPDMNTYRTTGRIVARFPANAELFANSVFWLAKMESMMQISPSAMEVARIEPMSKGALGFWRNGVLLIALPLLVVAAGAAVWFARRD